MPKKSQFEDIQKITQQNFAQVKENYKNLVFHWLKKSNSPVKHWEKMSDEFWEQVWVHHDRFNRKKSRCSTWLGWQWFAFCKNGARANKAGYEFVPLSTGDYTQQLKRSIVTTNWGLDPARQTKSPGAPDTVKDAFPVDKPALYEAPYQDAEDAATERANTPDRELIRSKLSQEEKKLISYLEDGLAVAEIASKLDVSVKIVYYRLQKIKALVAKQPAAPKVFMKTLPDEHWEEFFSTLAETTPLTSNDWSHAAMIRTRNRWLRNRGL